MQQKEVEENCTTQELGAVVQLLSLLVRGLSATADRNLQCKRVSHLRAAANLGAWGPKVVTDGRDAFGFRFAGATPSPCSSVHLRQGIKRALSE